MYSESGDENLASNNEFVRRLFALPVMADAFGQLNHFYCGTKDRNRLLKLTLETAESGVGAIVSTAQPVFSRYDKQILMLNNIACAQLDRLENNCPIITKPTDEVVKETKELCTGAIQPVVNCVNSVKDYGVRKVTGIRDYTGGKIDGIKRYGVDTVATATRIGSDRVTKVLSAPVCRGVLDRFDAALSVADRYVDDYLPEGSEEIVSKEKVKADIVVLSKAYQLSSKVQRRLYTRAARRLEKTQFQAKETIAKLNLVLNLMELTRSNVSGAKEKAWHVWQEITKLENQVVEDATKEEMAFHDSTFDRKAIATARQLMMKLRGIVSWIDVSAVSPVRSIPGAVQERLHNSIALIQALPESVRERVEGMGKMVHSLSDTFSKETISVKDLQSVLDNARNTLHQLYDSLTDLVDWTLKNTSGYQKIGQFFPKSHHHHNSEKSDSSTSSEESENDKKNQETFDQDDDSEKGQKETSEKESSDDEIPDDDTTGKNEKFTEEDRATETNQDASSDQQSGDEEDEETTRIDNADDQQSSNVETKSTNDEQKEEKTENDDDLD